jgi:hypothetical protein
LYGVGELPDECRGGIYIVRHPAAGAGVARFNANFHGAHSPTHHDTLYTMVRVNASNPEPCINHAARAADPQQWSREAIFANAMKRSIIANAMVGSTMLLNNRAHVLATAAQRGFDSPSEA